MPPTIVVIDDERSLVEFVCDLLTDEGMTAVPCPIAQQALPCLRQIQPHLALLDLQMPGMDGIEIFQAMRADPALKAMPVIFLTANAHLLKEQLPAYPAMGAALIPKPFNIITLLAQIEQMVGAA